MIATKYYIKVGDKPYSKNIDLDWAEDKSIDHITHNNRYTLCSVRIGVFDDGWVLSNYPDKYATCIRCLNYLNKHNRY
jgi:hypothetical protein